jgi:endonuclease/exonuclease/phosphatase family metal-dependent hydrolase
MTTQHTHRKVVHLWHACWLIILCCVAVGDAYADIIIPSDRVTTGVNVRDLNTDAIIGAIPVGESAKYLRTVPYYYVVELSDGTEGKVSRAWTERVSQVSAHTLTIATFNIQIFGKTKAGKSDVMAELADIIRQYDVVAIQEIRDKDEHVPYQFLETINQNGAAYAFLLSQRGGQQPDDQDSQEQYAYYYNTQTLRHLDPGALFDDSADDLFQREPFIAQFQSKLSDLSFVLITVHTRPESAVAEIKSLDTVVHAAEQQYSEEDDFVVLGDFNASCDYAAPEDFVDTPIRTQYQWIVPDDADTNVSTSTACAYDRILITPGMDAEYTGQWGIGTVSSKSVSDHYSVWAGFTVNESP